MASLRFKCRLRRLLVVNKSVLPAAGGENEFYGKIFRRPGVSLPLDEFCEKSTKNGK